MKNILLSLVLLAIAVFSMGAMIDFAHGAAPTMFFVDGSTSFERERLTRIEHTLNFTKVAMPNTWDIHILPKEQFEENTKRMKLNTISAYTFLPLDQTYINEWYLTYADDSAVRHTLAHEAGHMICACSSEQKANEIAWAIE